MSVQRKNLYDVNRRSIVAIRSVGLGQRGLETFCAHMDLPKPVGPNAHRRGIEPLHEAVMEEAQKSMIRAAREEAELSGGNDVAVSGDGSWQKRGHNSSNGLCSVIGLRSGKVIDLHVASKVRNFWIVSIVRSNCSYIESLKVD